MFLSSPTSPRVGMRIAKYLMHNSFWDISPTPTSSWLWKSILRSRPLSQQGCCHLIRNGSSTKIWKDPWIPTLPSFKPTPKNSTIYQALTLTVDSLIDPITRQWNLTQLEQLFDSTSIRAIRTLQTSSYVHEDRVIWAPDSKDKFSMKSAYHLILRRNSIIVQPFAKKQWLGLWKLKIHARLKLLLWKVAWNMLPTGHRISHIDPSATNTCPAPYYLCGSNPEIVEHLFLDCPVQQIIWRTSSFPLLLNCIQPHTIHELLSAIINPGCKLCLPQEFIPLFQLFATLTFDQVWMLRNKVKHNPGTSIDPLKLSLVVLRLSNEYKHSWRQAPFIQTCGFSSPPQRSGYRFQFDAAVRQDYSLAVVVCLDPENTVIEAETKFLPGISNPLLA